MLLTQKEFEPILSQRINEILKKEKIEAKAIGPFLPRHLEYFTKLSITNGKKIRGYLVYLGYNLIVLHETIPDWLIDLAAAIEIFHTAILIHDDIEDESPTR